MYFESQEEGKGEKRKLAPQGSVGERTKKELLHHLVKSLVKKKKYRGRGQGGPSGKKKGL